jgi:hypothetical protein
MSNLTITQKEWLSPIELELEYGFSKSSQAKMRMTNNKSTIPFSKIGKYVRYNRERINEWLHNHEIQ